MLENHPTKIALATLIEQRPLPHMRVVSLLGYPHGRGVVGGAPVVWCAVYMPVT